MTTVEEIIKIKRMLKYTWIPFFSKFGKLTDIQLKTIPEILQGKNVVIASPTASGKTEAVVAPVTERCLLEKSKNLSVVYIVPTKALANDVYRRIEWSLREIGIEVDVKHGDNPLLNLKKLPNFLITTPESLDSLICRCSNILSSIRTVIVDEIHFLDNTYRGDQMRILLKRLSDLVNKQFNIHLISATLFDPEAIANRYLDNFEIIKSTNFRKADYQILDDFTMLHKFVRNKGFRKILCFCNMRENVEKIANEIIPIWHPYPVFVHHGSLSKQERLETERQMKELKISVCVCTSTLEIGIDIGDIDLIVLADVPWSVTSLIQRIGRGSRREEIINVVAVLKNREEQIIMERMFDLANSGLLIPEPYEPDKSVAVQQIFSLLFQKRDGLDSNFLYDKLSKIVSYQELTLILKHLESNEFIENKRNKWFASYKLMDLGERGFIHSNIPDEDNLIVIEIDSGKEIGKISGIFDTIFILSGKIWKVVNLISNKVYVEPFRGDAQTASFIRYKKYGKYYNLLPPEMKKLFRV